MTKPTSKPSSEALTRAHTRPRLALTSGEPAGVGPELCAAVADAAGSCDIVCLCDRELLRARMGRTAAPDFQEYPAHGFSVLHVPLRAPCVPGQLDVRNAPYVVELLDRAIDGCLSGEFDAMVTAPVQKSIINNAGIPFTGHTEYLAARTGAELPVMLLAHDQLRVALATTHLPLQEVSSALTVDGLTKVLTILDRELRTRWSIARPRIGVCGLNPHAGEHGHLGDEEERIIAPALEALRARGLHLAGPLPADTIFVPRILAGFDAVLAMYHDQGLPVLKHVAFDCAVNVTLGLPIIRTSVDHGTALDLAGTQRAESGSLRAAIGLAMRLASQRATARTAES